VWFRPKVQIFLSWGGCESEVLSGREGRELSMSSSITGLVPDATKTRRRFLERLRGAGIDDPRVLEAFAAVPRHLLVPEALRDQAYKETPIPIGEGQTISAPGVVAAMTMALELEGDERVLEIGTGSGYQAAILGQLVSQVISIERIPRLAASARTALDQFGVTNVVVYLGDGTRGRADHAPYDRIVVTAGGPEVPKPLLDQLALGGMLVGPFGVRGAQKLTRIRRCEDDRFTHEVLGECDFVDLIGQNGWQR
jgi:protein-L-isoaspartate(D-aspartate) O-methyltransferase